MILKPTIEDVKGVGYYLGKIMLGFGLAMLIPIALGVALGEINPVLDFAIGIVIAFIFSALLHKICRTEQDLNWMQSMIIAALAWLVAMVLGAVPLYLSGGRSWMPASKRCRALPPPA